MAIKNVGDTWASVVLTKDEIWVVNSGEILVSTDASADRTGSRILWGQAAPFKAGTTVFYMRAMNTYTEIERMG